MEVKETLWEVTQIAVVPCEMYYSQLKKCFSWLVAHDYHGRMIFETRARAELYFHELAKRNIKKLGL